MSAQNLTDLRGADLPALVDAEGSLIRLNIRGAIIETITSFGSTWLREDQLAAALGFELPSIFRAMVEHAGLYRGGQRRMEVLTDKGHLDIYSLNGAHQICLFVQAHRSGERAERARELIGLLQMLRSPMRIEG
jgi:hypothetical protein